MRVYVVTFLAKTTEPEIIGVYETLNGASNAVNAHAKSDALGLSRYDEDRWHVYPSPDDEYLVNRYEVQP